MERRLFWVSRLNEQRNSGERGLPLRAKEGARLLIDGCELGYKGEVEGRFAEEKGIRGRSSSGSRITGLLGIEKGEIGLYNRCLEE